MPNPLHVAIAIALLSACDPVAEVAEGEASSGTDADAIDESSGDDGASVPDADDIAIGRDEGSSSEGGGRGGSGSGCDSSSTGDDAPVSDLCCPEGSFVCHAGTACCLVTGEPTEDVPSDCERDPWNACAAAAACIASNCAADPCACAADCNAATGCAVEPSCP